MKRFAQLSPDASVFVSVAPSQNKRIQSSIRANCAVPITMYSLKDMSYFLNPKVDQQRTGIDRVLCAYGASKEGQRSIILIDAGSAITIDLVLNGKFQGGIIMPGKSMARNALFNYTELVKPKLIAQKRSQVDLIGKTTERCVSSFTDRGIPMMIDAYIKAIRRETGKRLPVVATGGDARNLSTYSGYSWAIDDHLSLKSLARLHRATTNQFL